MSREVPILFSAPMVKVNRAGLKWQTRRAVKPQPDSTNESIDTGIEPYWYVGGFRLRETATNPLRPRWRVGDTLWVRENFYVQPELWATNHDLQPVEYAADVTPQQVEDYVLKPSIHMPRWACRDTYTVTGVRCERLQDISEEDAIAEGVERFGALYRNYSECRCGDPCYCAEPDWFVTARESYVSLWESINGPGSWDADPWGWIVEYDNPARAK